MKNNVLISAFVMSFLLTSAVFAQQVNTFTGAFNYSIPVITIPGPNGSDYTVNLIYQSGASPESEASWVGYGGLTP
jgi:hypothetical protein